MADLLRTAANSLKRQGVPNADELARGLVSDLRKELGGNQLYINKAYSERNAEIRAQYTGRNAEELARRYGLSKQTILNIV